MFLQNYAMKMSISRLLNGKQDEHIPLIVPLSKLLSPPISQRRI